MSKGEAARLVRVAEAPTIPSRRFRGYAGPADLPPMAEAQNEAHAADGVDEAVTPDVLANDLLGDARIDVERDIVIVELDRIIAGWSGRWRWVEDATGDAILSHRGYLAPAARRRGIGRALLRHNECQLREDALLPAAPRDTRRRAGSSRCFGRPSTICPRPRCRQGSRSDPC